MTTRQIRWVLMAGAVALAALCAPREAAAQVDPLLFLKRTKPNIIVAVDTSARMRLDADGTYYDPVEYTVNGAGSDAGRGARDHGADGPERRPQGSTKARTRAAA